MVGLTACSMSVLGSPCEESGDPRHEGACYRCGKPIINTGRNLDYERDFLKEAERIAERRYGIPVGGFQTAVARRLEFGQEQYGTQYMDERDAAKRAQEIAEEAQDAGAYSVLDAQTRLNSDTDDSAAWHLHEVAIHAAAIHYHATQLKRG